jgi:hypothetical protein
MRVLPFTVAFAIGVLGGFACPAQKKCTPTTCMGCCSANDTCESGASTSACGANGSACDRCISTQLCAAGRCEAVGGTGGGSAGGGAAGGGAASDELTGTFRVLLGWNGDAGVVAALADPPRATVGVWFRDGGTPDFKRGFANADGTFVVRDVPPGEVTLQLNRTYVVTSARRLSLDFTRGGRNAPLATMESTLRVTVRGLDAIGPGKTVGFFFDQATRGLTNLENFGMPSTPAGSTSIEAAEFNWKVLSDNFGQGLPDSTQGDQGWAIQYAETRTDAGTSSYLARVGPFAPVTLANGGSAETLATVAATAGTPFTLTFDRPAYTAFRASLGRDAPPGRFSFRSAISPASSPRGRGGDFAVTLASADWIETEPAPSVPVGSGFPSSWGQVVNAAYFVTQDRSLLPDGGSPTRFFGTVGVVDLPENVTGTVGVRLGPVRGAQVSARSFLEDQTGVGLTPTVSWTAPSMGTVTTYSLVIGRLTTTGSVTQEWTIYTTNPAVTVPPGILTTGGAYVFELGANSSPAAAGPLNVVVPYAYSSVISGVIRP